MSFIVTHGKKGGENVVKNKIVYKTAKTLEFIESYFDNSTIKIYKKELQEVIQKLIPQAIFF